MTFLLVSVAGGIGCMLRFGLSALFEKHNPLGFPIATAAINILGAFLLGLLTAVAADIMRLSELKAILGVGLLGGFTTFSAASVEAAQLVLGQGSRTTRSQPSAVRVLKGAGLAATMLLLAVAAGALGLVLG